MDSRVQDYLDDRLQSSADLDSLDTLLENVKQQQELLKNQASKEPLSPCLFAYNHEARRSETRSRRQETKGGRAYRNGSAQGECVRKGAGRY